MPRNTQLTNAIVNAQADLLARELDDGYLRIYSGAQPISADTAITDQILLAELRFDDPSSLAAVDGVLNFAVAAGVAMGTGTAAWSRALNADGTSAAIDGTVGLIGSNSNIELNNLDLIPGAIVAIETYVHVVQKSTAGL